MKKFMEAAYRATQSDPLMHASIKALLEALATIEAAIGQARRWPQGTVAPQ